jgi:LmbE family N-acetylglucosaminyl deacetylase
VEKLVFYIRKLRPDVLFAFDPGKRYQRWHKSDHRAAAYLAADAARAAMWRLLFEGHILQDGLKAHEIPEYMLYDGAEEDMNTWVDISSTLEKKLTASTRYVSQWGPGWQSYKGARLSPEEEKESKDRARQRVRMREGKPVEGFRHYKGLPDSIGK